MYHMLDEYMHSYVDGHDTGDHVRAVAVGRCEAARFLRRVDRIYDYYAHIIPNHATPINYWFPATAVSRAPGMSKATE